jgi:hypothetical protein
MALVVAFEFAIAGFCCHSERSEESRRTQHATTIGTFNQDSLPLLYLLVIFQRSEGTHRQQHMQLN